MYVGAGALGRRGWAFAGWTFIAALVWTALVVLLVALLGDAFAAPFSKIIGHGPLALFAFVGTTFLLLCLSRRLARGETRHRLIARISKLWRWEFWPAWLFYLPLVPWLAWLIVRHRSLMVITAANPGIPHGGVVGESKHDILARIAGPHVLPGRLISSIAELSPDDFPLVLKPDAGQRGAGVRLCATIQDAADYLRSHPTPVLAQSAHPGPFEAGIFYYRIPGAPRGRIFSITDKHFPVLTGDGVHTVRQLIWRHPRFRMQGKMFLQRHAAHADGVLAPGAHFVLARAGNHCQGTLFCDGRHLLTAELEFAIDSIARRFEDGFYFGRFDVRYDDVDAFRRGEDFAVIELNGVTSESTNLYDPAWPMLRAYRTLFAQWSLLFRIGAASRRLGNRPSRLRDVVREAIAFYRRRDPDLRSD
jgi:hypothetical protein